MNRLRLFSALLLIVALSYAGDRAVGPLPPLRPLLDPWVGAWQLARTATPPDQVTASIPGLEAPVEVRVDQRGVPHVFATSERDAWRAQGWLVARDRLFQLNLQTRATAGTLTEWVGARALAADRSSRRMGLARAAERQWAALAPDDPSRLAMEAYAEGVNAWITSLDRAHLPLEYRLLGVRPDRWEPQHTLYFFQQMSTVLAVQDVVEARERAAALIGWPAAEALLPMHSPVQEPIQPNGQFAPRTDPLRLPPPGLPDSVRMLAAGLEAEWPSLPRGMAGDAIGSNNWAVSARRSATGHALLAGDPHLSLSLPSIWYEMHLVVPGTLDVAGATMPSAPGILIGFNRSLAWSVTNTGADVLDVYRETVDDATAPTRYLLDGAWQPLVIETSEFHDQRGRLLALDTLRFTHRGPMTLRRNEWQSTRWTMQELVPDPDAWIHLDRAESIDGGLAATVPFVGPAQNFVMADSSGAIAIRSTGRYPLRPGDGRGDLVRDGSTRGSDWIGWVPVEHYPGSRSPAQGYLASNNQEPMDPRVGGEYLGADWPTPWRAMRINALLRADSAVTPEAMRRFQTDRGSAAAEFFVPHFLRAAAAALTIEPGRLQLARGSTLLGEWDRHYDLDNRRAVLFEQILAALGRELWDEMIPPGDSVPMLQPGQDITAALLEEPGSPWWDDRRTPEVEDRDAILARAIELGLARTIGRFGEPDDARWRWGAIRTMNIHHLLRLAPLSRLAIPMASGTGSLNPSGYGGSHGASWRMVVELGPVVSARTTYPGGQSANPVSPWYADRLTSWTNGELATALFPATVDALTADQVVTRITLHPGGAR